MPVRHRRRIGLCGRYDPEREFPSVMVGPEGLPARSFLFSLSAHRSEGEVVVMRGQVNKLKADRGFGFIRSTAGEEVFFHQSAVSDGGFDQLREGQEVTFEVESSPRGPRAWMWSLNRLAVIRSSARATARRTSFSSSRMFPGQSYPMSRVMTSPS